MNWILELVRNEYRVCFMHGSEDNDIQIRIEDLHSKKILLLEMKKKDMYEVSSIVYEYILKEWESEFGKKMREIENERVKVKGEINNIFNELLKEYKEVSECHLIDRGEDKDFKELENEIEEWKRRAGL